MPESKFKKGDLVTLKSNPEFKMTVNDLKGLFMVECSWIDELGRPQKEMFNKNSLMFEGSQNEGLLLG